MELRHIRYFLAVARARHFTRAARELGIGQPPLSIQIKDLEREVGVALFHRVPHGAELTEAGQAFLDTVAGMPALAERATLRARRAARGELGILRIGFTASAAFNAVVPASLRAFRRAYKEVELVLEEANTTRLVNGLRDESLDVVFIRPDRQAAGEFRLRTMSEEALVLALPATHPAAAATRVDLSLMGKEAFVLFPREIGPALHDTIVSACRQAGFEPRIEQLVPQVSSIVNLVAAGGVVSLVPLSMAQLQVAGVTFRRVAGEVPSTRLALAQRRTEQSSLVRNFVQLAATV